MEKRTSNLRLSIAPQMCLTFIILGLTAIDLSSQANSSVPSDFKGSCREVGANESSYVGAAYFSPVRRRGDDECKQTNDFWCYEHTSSTHSNRYKDSAVTRMPDPKCPEGISECASITFFSAVVNPKDFKGLIPQYIWHVISVPRPRRNVLDGYMVITEDVIDEGFIRDRHKKTLRLSHIETEEGMMPVYIQESAERDFSKITNMWGALVGTDAWKNLIQKTYDNQDGSADELYDHTFYIFDLPNDVAEIGENGWRHVSKRTAIMSGTAFGFVLDPEGKCLAADMLEIR